MKFHIQDLSRLSSDMLQGALLEHHVYLCFEDCRINVHCSHKELADNLIHYFSPFLTDGSEMPDITIQAIISEPPEFDRRLQVKTPDLGKIKIKEEWLDLAPNSRLVHKRLTGMAFVFGGDINLAAGPCLENANQVINFINNRFIAWKLNQGYLLGHAAGVTYKGKGMAIAGFSGMGKSTLALHLMSRGTSFVSNDRLMALADQTLHGNPSIFRLFAHRFSKEESQANLFSDLEKMIAGKHCLVVHIPDPMRKIIRHHLLRFQELMPADFDLHGASIGNLILTAGFLENRRHPDLVIYTFSKLVEVRGVVRPVINENYHLAVELEDGRIIEGQHQITGKEVKPLTVPVKRLFIIDREKNGREITVCIRNKVKELICNAELICYPMGSFYTSLLATLLPKGIGAAISQNSCPKVFIPSMGFDPETIGMTVMDQVLALLATLQKNAPDSGVGELLNFVIIDSKRGTYNTKPDKREIRALGIEVIDMSLVSKKSKPLIDSMLLLDILLSLA